MMTKEELEKGMINTMNVILQQEKEEGRTAFSNDPTSLIQAAAVLLSFIHFEKEIQTEDEMTENANAILEIIDFDKITEMLELEWRKYASRN